VQNHDDGHDQGDDVHEGCGALENDRVGQFDVARIAVGFNAKGVEDGRVVAHH